jgi:hypothetical protein
MISLNTEALPLKVSTDSQNSTIKCGASIQHESTRLTLKPEHKASAQKLFKSLQGTQ